MKHIPLLIMTLFIAPLSAQAQNDDVKIIQVKNNIYQLISPMGGNVTVSTGEDGTFIFDDQLSGRSEIIKSAVKSINDQDIKFILNTHYHFDHTGGNEFFGEENAIIVAHDNVRKRLSTEQFITYFSKKMPPLSKAGLPVVTFSKDITFHHNNDDIKITHIPNAHTDGDAIAYFTNQNIIVAGDIIFNGMYPFIDTEHGGSIHGLIAAHDTLLAIANDDTIIVPGHGPLMNKAELQTYRHALATITKNIERAIKDGKTLEQTIATKPTKDFDETLGKGFIGPDAFTTILYNHLNNK
ncbi:MAG: MBL fold metallo-hydrolase [Zetaproteobacteria bacterium]|nr:MAG: MBL fold metallo-hydrolase [Zetaproteobacteria bacterium]